MTSPEIACYATLYKRVEFVHKREEPSLPNLPHNGRPSSLPPSLPVCLYSPFPENANAAGLLTMSEVSFMLTWSPDFGAIRVFE